MIVAVLTTLGAFRHLVVISKVNFAPHQWFDFMSFSSIQKINRTKKVPVVCECKRWHAQFTRSRTEVVYMRTPIE